MLNIVTNPTVLYAIINMNSMTNYPPEMYNEVLKDYNFRYGKFNPIPYPKITELKGQLEEENNNERSDYCEGKFIPGFHD